LAKLIAELFFSVFRVASWPSCLSSVFFILLTTSFDIDNYIFLVSE
jgi:hypothetical protein